MKMKMTDEQLFDEVCRQINAAIVDLRKEGIIVMPPTNITIEKR
jgi:hypothetical protein